VITKAIMKAVDRAEKSAADKALYMAKVDLQAAIDAISSDLKMPGIDFGERLCLNAERKAFRSALEAQP
jgi:hypothetical protein